MRRITYLLIAAACVQPAPEASARRFQGWTYEDLKAKSDLVVIAIATKTGDTGEQSTLPGILTKDPATGAESKIPVIGVETQFEVSVVLKGPKRIKGFSLHHYRLAQPELFGEKVLADGSVRVSIGDPDLVSFEPIYRQSFLLFLVRTKDGRYEPTSGQTDPGYYSIHPLKGMEAGQPGATDNPDDAQR